jgi:hypothetical protein
MQRPGRRERKRAKWCSSNLNSRMTPRDCLYAVSACSPHAQQLRAHPRYPDPPCYQSSSIHFPVLASQTT